MVEENLLHIDWGKTARNICKNWMGIMVEENLLHIDLEKTQNIYVKSFGIHDK